jgi:hypothetical protein
MKLLKAYFHNKAQELTTGGIKVAANPEVCTHNVQLAQGNTVIGSCEHIFTYCWTFSFVYYFQKYTDFKSKHHSRCWHFLHHQVKPYNQISFSRDPVTSLLVQV